jgi:hypothetical protein
LDVPAWATPGFRAEHHRVTWYVVLDLGAWARREVRYPVTVEPAAPAESSPSGGGRLEEGPVSLWVDHRTTFPPGATLTGGYTLRAGDAGVLRTVELSVLWYTDDRGIGEMGVCHYEERAAEGGQAPLYGTRPFRAHLPQGPFSHDGKLVKLRWAVRLRLRYAGGEEVVRELPFRLGTARA